MFYAVTNHLYPKPDYHEKTIDGFAADRSDSITEHFDAVLFEMRRPVEGNEFLSTSVWSSIDAFNNWRNSQAIQNAHANMSMEPWERRGQLSFNDVVMSARPGQAPQPGNPERYPFIEPGTFVVIRRFTPDPERAQAIIDAYAAMDPGNPQGWVRWELWSSGEGGGGPMTIRGEWWSNAYFASEADANAAIAAGFPYLTEPGDTSWYQKPAAESRYVCELERVPGMDAIVRRGAAVA